MERYFSESALRASTFPVDNDKYFSFNAIDVDTLEDLPPADVAPIIHAHWKASVINGHLVDLCTNCWQNGDPSYNYCPYCGAKMDEEKEELNMTEDKIWGIINKYKAFDCIYMMEDGNEYSLEEELINFFNNEHIQQYAVDAFETFTSPSTTIYAVAVSWLNEGERLEMITDTF